MKKLLTLSIMASTLLFGADDIKDDFVTHTELGYVNTTGNTNVETFSLNFGLKKNWDAHHLNFDLDAIYGTEDKIENNNKIVTEINYDYQFATSLSVNYLAGYKRDPFAGFKLQAYTGPGLKYIAVKNETINLDFQTNILYSYDDELTKYYGTNKADGTPDPDSEIVYPYADGTSAANITVPGKQNSYTGWMLKGNFLWQINENVKATQYLSFRSDFEDIDNHFLTSKTAIISKIKDIFSMGVSYKYDYVGKPPLGNVNADKTFMVSLIIDYDLKDTFN